MKYIWKKREVTSVKWQLKKPCKGVTKLSITHLFAYVFVGKTFVRAVKGKATSSLMMKSNMEW